jgi:AraC family transcriptional regulator, regulatory protein of adaptative response / DNA-3-methyladenine glycosylase II
MSPPLPTPEVCYRVLSSRDSRYDGVFYVGVTSTGIYCRPSCPARTPAAHNVTYHLTAAAAQGAGFRACKRCIPDATPGSPDWDVAADLAGRAMRLINDGAVDREGVPGLARALGYSERQLNRLLVTQLGATPLQLARAKRAMSARTLLETTSFSATEVAFAAGYSSVRQFNDSFREVYAATPTQLRSSSNRAANTEGLVSLRIGVRTPFAGVALREFFATRAVAGIEVVQDHRYARSLDLPHGPGAVCVHLEDFAEPGVDYLQADFVLSDLRDLAPAVERVRRLLDADADPIAVSRELGRDVFLGPHVAKVPGLRVPGHVNGHELAVRAVLGQQVSVAGARTLASRLVQSLGRRVSLPWGLDRIFPTSEALASMDPITLAMPASRRRALLALCSALAGGQIMLDRSTPRHEVREQLLNLPGIGPWTADYILMRALGDPDVFLPTDVGVRNAWRHQSPHSVEEAAAQWRPWRSYALMYLWQSLNEGAN